jgi:hypothetical protein
MHKLASSGLLAPDRPLSEIKYTQGTDPLQIASWFDKASYIEFRAGPLDWHDSSILHQGPITLVGRDARAGVRCTSLRVQSTTSKVSEIDGSISGNTFDTGCASC